MKNRKKIIVLIGLFTILLTVTRTWANPLESEQITSELDHLTDMPPTCPILIPVEPAPPVLIPNYRNAIFQDPRTGVKWRVLVPNDGNGNALIITEKVWNVGNFGVASAEYVTGGHMNNRYNLLNEFRLFDDSTVIRERVAYWFNNDQRVGEELRRIALSYKFVDNEGEVVDRFEIGAGIELDISGNTIPLNVAQNAGQSSHLPNWSCTLEDAFTSCPMTRAISRPAGEQGEGEAFILSATEVNTFLGNTRSERLGQGNAEQGWTNDATGRGWWLRSPGDRATDPMRFVGSHGNFVTSSATNTVGRGIRPALWVHIYASDYSYIYVDDLLNVER